MAGDEEETFRLREGGPLWTEEKVQAIKEGMALMGRVGEFIASDAGRASEIVHTAPAKDGRVWYWRRAWWEGAWICWWELAQAAYGVYAKVAVSPGTPDVKPEGEAP